GIQKYWDLQERVLPEWTPRRSMTERQATRLAAEYSLRSLGVATSKDISQNFVMRYPELAKALAGLLHDGRIEPVQVEGLAGTWFVHSEDTALLDRIESGEWRPRTTLLSPFDNLIRDRARLARLFDFDYRMEIYVPKTRRRFGY